MNIPHHYPKQQKGSALIVGMVFLLVLMIGATSLMNLAVTDERMTGNSKSNTHAFLAAEAGRTDAYYYLADNWSTYTCSVGAKLPGFDNSSYDAANGSTYTVSVRSCSADTIAMESVGRSANAIRTIVFDIENMSTSIDPPAAISCFGGGCSINPGNASDAAINGRDHPVPSEGCSGSSCWTDPKVGGKNIPAVFLNDPDNSTLTGANGKKKNSYVGQSHDHPDSDDIYSSGNDIDSEPVWNAAHYSLDENGNSTAPTTEQYFGANGRLSPIIADSLNADSSLGTWSSPKTTRITQDTSVAGNGSNAGYIVVDNGSTISWSGTGYFAGIIILKGCSKFSSSGNFTIYGAVIVDATDCGDESYSPFVGNGTPDVKYSSQALENTGNAILNGLVMNDWYEAE